MIRVLLSSLVALTCTVCSAEEVPLTALDLTHMKQAWGKPQLNKSVEENPLTIAGRKFDTGVGTHAASRLMVELDGKAEMFQAWVGLDSGARETGSVEFEVYTDGNRIFESGVMRKDTPAKQVNVALSGVKELILKVSDGGDGRNYDHADWAEAKIVTAGARPVAFSVPEEEKYILTPPAGPAPRINAPTVYGARPGNPFLYRIPATGDRPMQFKADSLPDGLSLESATGIITGITPAKGEYELTLHASNSSGKTSKTFTIKSGDTLSLTPYMGWNTWYTYYMHITDKRIRDAADAMVSSGMADYGYDYIGIDDCWMRKPGSDDPMLGGEPRDASGNILPNKHFPNMNALTDYIHSKGMKAGIYTSPGPLTCQSYTGSFEHETQDARQFADWGFDLLKYDWCSYGKKVAGPNPSLEEMIKPFQIMGDALKVQKRDIIYNLCQYGMGNVWEWGADVHAQSWRTAGDLGYELDQIITIARRNVEHRAWNGPGRWNDPDYLQIGTIGDIKTFKKGEAALIPSPLTPTEQYSFMSLWCLMASPLVYSGDITHMDDFTLNILCNHEVIEVNQDPLGQCAAIADLGDDSYLLVKQMADGSKAIGLCNGGESTATLKAEWSAVGIQGKHIVRDVWRHKDIGTFEGSYQAEVPRHGVSFLRLRKAK